MTLIKSISGIRGTIGGVPGDNLTPTDLLRFTAAYGTWLKTTYHRNKYTVVVGRDARISGEMIRNIVVGTLNSIGINVLDAGLATTPTVEIAVTHENADGGIILTASHNPKEWNALKLLNNKGEFISANDGERILKIAEEESYSFVKIEEIGYTQEKDYIDLHIQKILDLNLIDKEAIVNSNFKVAIDCVNSVGGIAIPKLLSALGVKHVDQINCKPDGKFSHNPEPLPENLKEISEFIKNNKIDMGFVVDPDVDRLAIICEDGSMFGEEFTLVAVSDYILKNKAGNTVSNLSSTMALRDVTESYQCNYFSSAVGEVNVVEVMKEVDAIIGGEGNGGIIFPDLHYGRDALVGIALFLSFIANEKISCKSLRKKYPEYYISKNKIKLPPELDIDKMLKKMVELYKDEKVITIDGVKIEFKDKWVHLRKSNTEPIIRIYAEAKSKDEADRLSNEIIEKFNDL